MEYMVIILQLLAATMKSGPLSPRTAHPEVADGGMASNMEGSYKYIE